MQGSILDRVGGIPVAAIKGNFEILGCPVNRVKITFSNHHDELYLDLKSSGRIYLYDRRGKERVWLSYDSAPRDFEEDYGCAWNYRVTMYNRGQRKVKIFCPLPDHAIHNLRMIMENGVKTK